MTLAIASAHVTDREIRKAIEHEFEIRTRSLKNQIARLTRSLDLHKARSKELQQIAGKYQKELAEARTQLRKTYDASMFRPRKTL